MKRLITLFWRWWYRCHPKPSKYTREEALAIAKVYELDAEMMIAMKHGCTPDKALLEWEYLYNTEKRKPLGLPFTLICGERGFTLSPFGEMGSSPYSTIL